MKLLLQLSRDCLELSKEEAKAVLGRKDIQIHDNILLVNSRKKYSNLAYTHKAFEFLFSCKADDIEQSINKFNWNKVIKGSYSVKKLKTKISTEKRIAVLIWRTLKNPKIDLKNSQYKIHVLSYEDKIFFCKLLWENPKDYMQRKAHLRPILYPSSLHPKIAKACVNLLNAGKGSIVDPFCGTGGILIEASLLGHKIIGYDINDKMLKSCEKNFKHYNIQNYKLKNKDALTLDKRYNFIISDLPYGLNTKNIPNSLYFEFLKKIKENKVKTAVVMFPHFVKYKPILKKLKMKIINEFSIYIHKSLTKKIIFMKNP
jgi:tRNA (guanine10-N2)-dimethyltransferase